MPVPSDMPTPDAGFRGGQMLRDARSRTRGCERRGVGGFTSGDGESAARFRQQRHGLIESRRQNEEEEGRGGGGERGGLAWGSWRPLWAAAEESRAAGMEKFEDICERRISARFRCVRSHLAAPSVFKTRPSSSPTQTRPRQPTAASAL